MIEYEVVVYKRDGGRDYAFCKTLSQARDQVFEFMCAYQWARVEIIYPEAA